MDLNPRPFAEFFYSLVTQASQASCIGRNCHQRDIRMLPQNPPRFDPFKHFKATWLTQVHHFLRRLVISNVLLDTSCSCSLARVILVYLIIQAKLIDTLNVDILFRTSPKIILIALQFLSLLIELSIKSFKTCTTNWKFYSNQNTSLNSRALQNFISL